MMSAHKSSHTANVKASASCLCGTLCLCDKKTAAVIPHCRSPGIAGPFDTEQKIDIFYFESMGCLSLWLESLRRR